jgi:hypothetical protein
MSTDCPSYTPFAFWRLRGAPLCCPLAAGWMGGSPRQPRRPLAFERRALRRNQWQSRAPGGPLADSHTHLCYQGRSGGGRAGCAPKVSASAGVEMGRTTATRRRQRRGRRRRCGAAEALNPTERQAQCRAALGIQAGGAARTPNAHTHTVVIEESALRSLPRSRLNSPILYSFRCLRP